MRDAVVPAERVFIQEDPGISHAERGGRQVRRKNPPSSQSAIAAAAVETCQFESSGAQTGCAASMDNQQVLIRSPEQARDRGCQRDDLQTWRTRACHFEENESEKSRRRADDHAIHQRRQKPQSQGSTFERDIDARTLFDFLRLNRFNEDTAHRRRRRRHFWDFENTRALHHRLGKLVGRGGRGAPGKPREFDDLGASVPDFWPGLRFGFAIVFGAGRFLDYWLEVRSIESERMICDRFIAGRVARICSNCRLERAEG